MVWGERRSWHDKNAFRLNRRPEVLPLETRQTRPSKKIDVVGSKTSGWPIAKIEIRQS
jgi:hypothetical protein